MESGTHKISYNYNSETRRWMHEDGSYVDLRLQVALDIAFGIIDEIDEED